ncbi:MAG: hypothetical protein JKY66_00090 [Spongiibacteraceae bacterium]|nr:hypothetical protein [Spongiibacteraceae bacterium]
MFTPDQLAMGSKLSGAGTLGGTALTILGDVEGFISGHSATITVLCTVASTIAFIYFKWLEHRDRQS